jgi:hypothetical protein
MRWLGLAPVAACCGHTSRVRCKEIKIGQSPSWSGISRNCSFENGHDMARIMGLTLRGTRMNKEVLKPTE